MFTALFALGAWFWVLAIVELIIITWFVEVDSPLLALLSVFLFLTGIWWLAEVPVIAWIQANPLKLLKYTVYYVIIGLLWSFGKYYFQLGRIRDEVKRVRYEWQHKQDSEKYPTFKSYLDNKYGFRHLSGSGKEHFSFEKTTQKLTTWSTFWPISMVWTLLNDPIKKFFRWLIFDVFVSFYKRMYHRMVGRHLEE